MTLTQRTATYDPSEHLRRDYPTWWVTSADLGGRSHEIVCAEAKLVVFDPAAFDNDIEWGKAHIAAHFAHHAGQIGALTGELCSQADYLALLWLDRACDRLKN